MGRPRKEVMDKKLWSLVAIWIICYGLCLLTLNSRLKKLEASTYSAQQPQERNYFADAGNAVISFKCGDTVHLFGFRVTAK